jgi:hypothetical protein
VQQGRVEGKARRSRKLKHAAQRSACEGKPAGRDYKGSMCRYECSWAAGSSTHRTHVAHGKAIRHMHSAAFSPPSHPRRHHRLHLQHSTAQRNTAQQ